MNINDDRNLFLTIAELAKLLNKSKSSVHKLWPQWSTRFGLKPIRFNGSARGQLLFSRKEIDAMIDQWRISGG